MKIIIQKYGGSSLATSVLIKRIAERVIQTKKSGYEAVVVVSALGDTTDHLVELSKSITKNPSRREMDMLLSVGEQISVSLIAMALIEKGYPAISFTGAQAGIITSATHGQARVLEIKSERIQKELKAGKIVIVAGYQGVSIENEITTLGRGGSDTTAVALAAALEAERCEIMTDVDGIYTANPSKIKEARLISELSHDEMLDLAELGSQVLKSSAVEFAKRHQVKIHVGSSFTGKIGTIVTNNPMDKNRTTGIAIDDDISVIKLKNGSKQTYFSCISECVKDGIGVRYLWQDDQVCKFITKTEDLPSLRKIVESQKEKILLSADEKLSLLSVIGSSINFGSDIMAKLLGVFQEMDILPETYTFSETRISFCLPSKYVQEVATNIHNTLII